MAELTAPISVAIETTCRAGGLALGAGDELIEVVDFDAARRAATQVVVQLDDLLRRHGLLAADVDHLYTAVGPGSFTGTRVGVTVARTLAQTIPSIRCVAVGTADAVVANVADLPDIENLAVVLDARGGRVWAARFQRSGDRWVAAAAPGLMTPDELLDQTPRPLHLVGEGLGYHTLAGPDVHLAPEECWLPQAAGVWRVGRRMAAADQFIPYQRLLPAYTGQPEAVRVWNQRAKS